MERFRKAQCGAEATAAPQPAAPPPDPSMIRPWLPEPKLAALDEAQCAERLEVADIGSLRAIFRARATHRELLVSWADDLPTPLSGL